MKKLFLITILVAILLGMASPGFAFISTILPDGNAIIVSPFGEFREWEGGGFTMYIDKSSLNFSGAYIDTNGNPTGYTFGDYQYTSTIRRNIIYRVYQSLDGKTWEYWGLAELPY